MYKAKITSKGQITLPAEVRKALGLKPGGKIVFFEDGNGGFTVRRVGSIGLAFQGLDGFEGTGPGSGQDQHFAEGGSIQMPFQETFWAKGFGMVTDRFAIPWMVNCEKPMTA